MGWKNEGTMIKRRLISCLNNSCTSVYAKEDVENIPTLGCFIKGRLTLQFITLARLVL